MFEVGTGYLLWSPQVTMMTPMPQIELALAGHVNYLRLINGQSDDDETPAAAAASRPADELGDYLRTRMKG